MPLCRRGGAAVECDIKGGKVVGDDGDAREMAESCDSCGHHKGVELSALLRGDPKGGFVYAEA